MDVLIAEYLGSLELGELQVFENMGVVPLFSPLRRGPAYLTLKEALEEEVLKVSEVDEGGSVPDLQVVNQGEKPVLLLDGEELVGAKQNRVINTTILVPAKSQLVIPVSCTEAGRWHYVTRHFRDSNNVMAHSVRSRKAYTVTENLQAYKSFRSDQHLVWEEIDRVAERARVSSPTSAMRDVFEARRKELEEYLKAFPCQRGQRGLLVLINGRAVGMDVLSRAKAYKVLHPKLLKSYAMEAFLTQGKRAPRPSIEKARNFLSRAGNCEERKYRSVGMGWDYRFLGKRMAGSALVYRKAIVHAAFFDLAPQEIDVKMADFSSRRSYRPVYTL